MQATERQVEISCSRSSQTSFHSTNDNDDDLDNIRTLSSEQSSDSIIIRVEQEIAAARNAVNQRNLTAGVLSVTPIASPSRSIGSNPETSFERALGLLEDEFGSPSYTYSSSNNCSNNNNSEAGVAGDVDFPSFASQKALAAAVDVHASTWEEIQDVPGPGISDGPRRGMWNTLSSFPTSPGRDGSTPSSSNLFPSPETPPLSPPVSVASGTNKLPTLAPPQGGKEDEPSPNPQVSQGQTAPKNNDDNTNNSNKQDNKEHDDVWDGVIIDTAEEAPAPAPAAVPPPPPTPAPVTTTAFSASPASRDRRQRMAAAIRLQRSKNTPTLLASPSSSTSPPAAAARQSKSPSPPVVSPRAAVSSPPPMSAAAEMRAIKAAQRRKLQADITDGMIEARISQLGVSPRGTSGGSASAGQVASPVSAKSMGSPLSSNSFGQQQQQPVLSPNTRRALELPPTSPVGPVVVAASGSLVATASPPQPSTAALSPTQLQQAKPSLQRSLSCEVSAANNTSAPNKAQTFQRSISFGQPPPSPVNMQQSRQQSPTVLSGHQQMQARQSQCSETACDPVVSSTSVAVTTANSTTTDNTNNSLTTSTLPKPASTTEASTSPRSASSDAIAAAKAILASPSTIFVSSYNKSSHGTSNWAPPAPINTTETSTATTVHRPSDMGESERQITASSVPASDITTASLADDAPAPQTTTAPATSSNNDNNVVTSSNDGAVDEGKSCSDMPEDETKGTCVEAPTTVPLSSSSQAPQPERTSAVTAASPSVGSALLKQNDTAARSKVSAAGTGEGKNASTPSSSGKPIERISSTAASPTAASSSVRSAPPKHSDGVARSKDTATGTGDGKNASTPSSSATSSSNNYSDPSSKQQQTVQIPEPSDETKVTPRTSTTSSAPTSSFTPQPATLSMAPTSPFIPPSSVAVGTFKRNIQSNLKTSWEKPNPPITRPRSNKSSPSATSPTSQTSSGKRSNKLRFRDPFPVLKAPTPARPAKDIVADHATGKPTDPVRWIKPRPDLKSLIVAAMGSSLQRRSNACGALKVLLQGSTKNQMTMVRTDSFLASLVFAASQPIPMSHEREMALDSRTRAVACISAVCEPKDNRRIVLMYPGMVECLAAVMEQDDGEARVLACGACAMIAKSAECREALVDEDRLIKLLAQVLGGQVKQNPTAVEVEKLQRRVENPKQVEEKKDDCEDEKKMTRGNRPRNDSSDVPKDLSDHGDWDDDDSAYEDHNASFEGHESSSMAEGGEEDRERDDVSAHSHSGTDDGSSVAGGAPKEGEGAEGSDEKKEETKEKPAEIENPSIRKINKDLSKEFFQLARSNSCAAFLHLSKHCAVSNLLCTNEVVLHNILIVANETTNPIHTKCLEIILNFSRFPYNNAHLTTFKDLVTSLMTAGESEVPDDRVHSLRCFQNLSSDPSSKLRLATEPILTFITACAMRAEPEEKEAAVSTLYNLTTEPGAVVAITNTKNAVATLVHLAHNPTSSSAVRMRSSEALATISLWLQTLAGTGKVPANCSPILPTQRTTGWERWD